MENFRNPALIGIMLILMGVVLYVADKIGKREINVENIGLKRGLIVGLSQALAVIPGVSRSGITMSVGRLLGMTREGIARFTFLMSAPIILAMDCTMQKTWGVFQSIRLHLSLLF